MGTTETDSPAPPGSTQGKSSDRQDYDKLDRDKLFDVLSNERRRYAIHYLKQRDDEVDLSELSTQVTAWEQHVSPDEVCYDDRKSVHTALTQFHLPKMNDAGVVDFRTQRNEVSLTEEGAELTLYLETVEGDDIPWSGYFLLLSVFSTVFVGALATGAPGFAGITGDHAAAFLSVLFLCSSATFAYDSRYKMRLGGTGSPPGHDSPDR